jgi:hypothetical protein
MWMGFGLMRAYLAVSGSVFALLVIAHFWRLSEEGLGMLSRPEFLISTVAAGGLAAWAIALWRRSGVAA